MRVWRRESEKNDEAPQPGAEDEDAESRFTGRVEEAQGACVDEQHARDDSSLDEEWRNRA